MLINNVGEICLKGWDKRHWRECPAGAKRIIQAYIDAGWNLTHYSPLINKQIYVELERCDVDRDRPIAWHHSKQLRIKHNGTIALIRNGKSFTINA